MELHVAKTTVFISFCDGRMQRSHAVLQPDCTVHSQVHGKKELVMQQKHYEGTEIIWYQ